jgi:predicted RNase H-like HicB family nuclease
VYYPKDNHLFTESVFICIVQGLCQAIFFFIGQFQFWKHLNHYQRPAYIYYRLKVNFFVPLFTPAYSEILILSQVAALVKISISVLHHNIEIDIYSIFFQYIRCRPETPPLPAMTGDVAQVLFFYAIRDYYLMKLKVIVREAEEGGYWAEVPAIPGCVTQGETFDELLGNIYEAVEGCLSVDLKELDLTGKDKVLEFAV